MANHTTPTKEELDEQIRKDAEEAEKLSKTHVEDEEEDPTPPVDPTPDPVSDPEPDEEDVTPPIEDEEEQEEAEETEEEKKTKELEAEKNKSSASARENQKILAKNRVMNQAIIEAEDIPTPTEEDLSKEIGEDKWDVMSDVERDLFKETVISRKWREKIKSAGDQAKKIEKWTDSVDAFIGDPVIITANPALEGKQEEFRQFATQEENNSVPMKILVSAFLFEQSKVKPHKGSMFPSGSGGDKVTPKNTGKITIEQGRQLRETDYAKWKQMLKEGKIEDEI